MARKILVVWVLIASLALVPTADAKRTRRPKPITGSVDVQAVPFPGFWVVADGRFGCLLGQEGVSHVSIPFEAPFSGIFTAGVSEFEGDWDIYLFDDAGNIVAADNSGISSLEISVPDKLLYRLEAGQKVSIVVCNYIGSPTARVDYELTYAPPTKQVRGRPYRRSDEIPYAMPGAVFSTPTDVYVQCNWGPSAVASCVPLEFGSEDRTLSVAIEDDHAALVGAVVYQWSNTGGYSSHTFCGKTEEPIPVLPGASGGEVDVAVGVCGNSASTPTSGTIKVTYSNR